MTMYEKIMPVLVFWAFVTIFANPWFESKKLLGVTLGLAIAVSIMFIFT